MERANASKKILITGGAGFVGSNLVEDLTMVGYDVTALFHKTPPPSLMCVWQPLDLLAHVAIRNQLLWNEYDAIIHCAAMSTVAGCRANQKAAYQLNVTATRVLAEESNRHHSKFIYLSSDLVFDGSQGWYGEDDPVNPLSYYAETKAFAEEDVRLLCGDYLILRTSLLYGNHESSPGGFLSWTVDAMERDLELRLYLNQFRTILFVKDLSKVIDFLLHAPATNQTYHIAGPERMNRVEIGRRVAEAFGYSNPRIIPTKLARALEHGESDDVALRTDKIRNAMQMHFTSPMEGFRKSYQRWKWKSLADDNPER